MALTRTRKLAPDMQERAQGRASVVHQVRQVPCARNAKRMPSHNHNDTVVLPSRFVFYKTPSCAGLRSSEWSQTYVANSRDPLALSTRCSPLPLCNSWSAVVGKTPRPSLKLNDSKLAKPKTSGSISRFAVRCNVMTHCLSRSLPSRRTTVHVSAWARSSSPCRASRLTCPELEAICIFELHLKASNVPTPATMDGFSELCPRLVRAHHGTFMPQHTQIFQNLSFQNFCDQRMMFKKCGRK